MTYHHDGDGEFSDFPVLSPNPFCLARANSMVMRLWQMLTCHNAPDPRHMPSFPFCLMKKDAEYLYTYRDPNYFPTFDFK